VRVDAGRWAVVAALAHGSAAAPPTSSVGRLLDAVAALCGVRTHITYEGQAAIELEAAADPGERGEYEIHWQDGQLDPRAALRALIADLHAGAGAASASARFHRGLCSATVRACTQIALDAGVELAVLAGGVFQNRILLEGVSVGLERAGMRVLTPERLPPGDGAISFGQVAIAAAHSGRATGVSSAPSPCSVCP